MMVFASCRGEGIETMASSDIQCAYCGLTGEKEDFEQPNKRDANIFKYRGWNPFSGHLHYQCPSCAIILLVMPLDGQKGQPVREAPRAAVQNDSIRTML